MSSDTPKDSKPPTLADVAERAAVSTATVSRVLNTPDRVNEDTRTRVQEAVSALGYSPNFGARALAAKRTNTIGAIIPTMENAIFARGLQAFQEELGRAGMTLLVASSSYQADLEEDQIRTLAARGADGLLLIGFDRDPKIYDFLSRLGIPALVAWAHNPNGPVASIGFDNRAAMHELAQQVIAHGHTRLGMITAGRTSNDRARDRVAGVLDAMTQAGLSGDALAVIETDYGIDEGAQAFEQIMRSVPRPTAVLCGNDVLAVGALRQAHTMGLSVPGDMSITGFDDIELAKVAVPGLATVHVPHRQMGAESARALIRMVRDGSDEPGMLLQTSLTIRESLGPRP